MSRSVTTGNIIGAEGARHLADALKINAALQPLKLRCSSILDRHTPLTSSADNQIGDEGMQHLADALKVNTALRSLNHWGASASSLAALR
jgi:hypothetical protein